MRRNSTLTAVMVLLFLVAFSVSGAPSAIADECIQKTRSAMYSQTVNAKYHCEFDGRKLLINDFGRMTPAPEGVYKKLADGKECFIGKGGFVLYCNR